MPDMPNLDEIMKMAQEVQAEMQKAQDNLDKLEVEGLSGGGLVKVKASAKGRIIAVSIDESLLQRREAVIPRDSLNRRDLGPLRLDRQDRAGIHRRAVEQHRAGAARRSIARFLSTRQPRVSAQRVQ